MQISRSEQKRRIKEVEKLVGELATLPLPLIDRCPVSEEVRVLLKEAGALKGGAKKRQLKYITKLLRDVPLEDTYAFLSAQKGAALAKNKQLHEVEYWRDSLINEALAEKKRCQAEAMEWSEQWHSQLIDDIAHTLPDVDRSLVLRLAYLFVQTRNPRHSREIFRYLMALKEQQQMEK